MSSSLLLFIQTQLVRYGTTILMVLGCIGNAYVVFHFINIPLTVFTYEYGDPSLYLIGLCKARYYLFHVWGQMSRYFIILACIDRFALTNMNVNIRLLSKPYMARRLIGITTIGWHLFAIHIVIMTTVKNGRCGYFDLYSTLNSIYTLIFVCLIPPIIMSIFGYLTFRNMKQLRMRIQSTETTKISITIHRQDRNLLVMVLAEVVVYVVTMSLYPIIILELAITNSIDINKSLRQTQIENFILFMAQSLIYINASAPFYIYLIASKALRNDFKKTISMCCPWIIRQ
ncbi:unnamed protein product [Rotaria sordida]|uniref:G-protein coupled receptors family 1 profile domain-containing protein n=2 Tax=Rotaria sordida TaxID=392033 RepID=A0A819N5K2_9BILA|nr:unnamed protein product [Rotaria sordida]